MTRREFLAAGGLMTAFGRRALAQMHHANPMAPAPPLIAPEHVAPFVDALPVPPVLTPNGKRLTIPIQEFSSKVHRDLRPTRFWGYGSSMPGPTIDVRRGEALSIEWINRLPVKHVFAVDHNLMGAEKSRPESRAIVHVHGGRVPSASDGWPEDAYGPGKSVVYTYPNEQDAALLWYHDHAMGINRLNVCAGMAGLYVIRDAFEDALNLPMGDYEVPLVLMDRLIRTDGQLYYPVSQFPDAPWIPEYIGNCVLVNGKLLPYLNVQARKYRFRIANVSNARVFALSIDAGPAFEQIGTDQGLLQAPVTVQRLVLAPGERADVVVDFQAFRGKQLVLRSLASTLMRFDVATDATPDTSSLPRELRPVQALLESAAVRTRRLSLNEVDNDLGDPAIHLLDGKRWHDPVTEKPVLGSTEIWELVNTTEDVHPIHIHLVRFQILDRRPIDSAAYVYDDKLVYIGPATAPNPNEAGWKDTVSASPNAVTRIIVKFEGYTGRYVWHCHILEHEDNEMMRPYEVVAP